MPKGAGPMPGPKPSTPKSGRNGPNGTGGGTKTFKPPMPPVGKTAMTGSRDPSKKDSR